MTIADERLSEEGRTKRTGLLKAGDPRGEVACMTLTGPTTTS